MSFPHDHLEHRTLSAWLTASLSETDNARVEQHLEACPLCTERLEKLEPPADPLVQRLREMHRAGHPPAPTHAADANLLFGTFAARAALITPQQLVDACSAWVEKPSNSLAQILTQQGWLTATDHNRVQQQVDQHLGKPRSVKQQLLHETQDHSLTSTITLPPLSADKLKLKSLYSSGGIGQIWIAEDQVLGREVALKELLPEKANSRANRERFFREARITAQLTHPGTPPVYEFVEDNGHCWYTMKLIHGKTFTEVIAQYHLKKSRGQEVLSQFIQLLNTFVAVCNTIAYAHSKQILHRDLKGDNVMVGDFGEVIVLDWGIAKQLDTQRLTDPIGEPPATACSSRKPQATETAQGERLGTPAYMAPEQAMGLIDQINYRTDVYGLAALLYEVLTGRPPFVGEDIEQVMHQVEHHRPTSPGEIVAEIPPELTDICLQGLAKSPTERQQTASEIGAAVQNWIAQQAQQRRIQQERQHFFNLSQDLLAIHDKELRFRQTNSAWENILGWTRSDLEQLTILDILHPDEHAIFRQRREHVRAGNPMTKLEYRCRCRDGTYKWIRWSTTAIEGEAVGYSVGHDISDIKGPVSE